MGLRFCNEIVIAAEQLHPSPTTTAAAASATSNHSSSDGAGRPGGRKRSKDKGEEKEASASKEGGGGKKKEPAISVEASADASGVKKLQVNQVNQIKSFPANWRKRKYCIFLTRTASLPSRSPWTWARPPLPPCASFPAAPTAAPP